MPLPIPAALAAALACVALAAIPTRAPGASVDDLARVHLEALGGRDAVQALSALHAQGTLMMGDRELEVSIWAQRPDRVRVEIGHGEPQLVQGYDGVNPAWVWRPAAGDAPVELPPEESLELRMDAEFDDPLVAPASRGFTIDLAGEEMWMGKPVVRLLVTRIGWAPQTVWVHGDTFLIVQRSQRRHVGEVETELVTLLADYRPVAGVQLPHRLSVFAGDRLLHETKFRRVEANPWIPPGWFSAPKTRVAGP